MANLTMKHLLNSTNSTLVVIKLFPQGHSIGTRSGCGCKPALYSNSLQFQVPRRFIIQYFQSLVPPQQQQSATKNFKSHHQYFTTTTIKMSGRKLFVGGNWKMNGTKAEIKGLVDKLNSANLNDQTGISQINFAYSNCCLISWLLFLTDIVVSPPACYLEYTKTLLKPQIKTAGQNCYKVEKGAFTGDLSPQMLADVGADWVILGHSERRNVFGETDEVSLI